MEAWQEEQIQSLLSSEDENELFGALLSIASDIGFDYCAYGLRVPFPISNPKIFLLNNYPAEWQAIYQNNNYLNIDPTVHHGIHSTSPILWSDDLFASAPELWESAQSFNLNVGWAQSIRDATGAGGLITLARSADPLTKSELQQNEWKMVWFAQLAHNGLSRCILPKKMPQIDVKLTNRELSVLRWTADGKTAGEISHILSISERTVHFHINNVIEKLGVTNKLAAAVQAAVLGLLN